MLSSPLPTNGDLSTVSLLFKYPNVRNQPKSSSSNESLKHIHMKRKREFLTKNEEEYKLNSKKKMSFNLQKPEVFFFYMLEFLE